MQFLLTPNNRGSPPIPIPRTPYVCRQLYDGGPFLSYPNRVGNPDAAVASSDVVRYRFSLREKATPVEDQESFLQTWLYFGFIAELLCATSTDSPRDISVELGAPPERTASTDLISRIYETLVVEDGDERYICLDVDSLAPLVEIAKPRLPADDDLEGIKKYYHHLVTCLNHAHPVWVSVPDEFNHIIKYSIASIAELMEKIVRVQFRKLNIQLDFGHKWSKGFLNHHAQESMIAHGWCPSDIARVNARFSTIQTLNLVRMMDKSLPDKDHRHCTDFACNVGQIDMKNYKLGHQQEGCQCTALSVEEHVLDRILEKENTFPLIRLRGDLDNLGADIVEYTPGIPYVAISHVWADGLGNPDANSVNRCKLVHLRGLTSKLDVAEVENDGSLIWLDTLCCPAADGAGKKRAIEKIRLVYREATVVLVLDAGLMAYESISNSQTRLSLSICCAARSWASPACECRCLLETSLSNIGV